MVVQWSKEALERELARVEQLRDPPVPVHVVTMHPGEVRGGLLYGWSSNVTDDNALRGLVTYEREYARGFWTRLLNWSLAERLSPR